MNLNRNKLSSNIQKKGCELNEFDAHRFLEKINETLSVKDMRTFLKSVDIDFNKMVSLTEYLVSRFKVKWKELIEKPQDDEKSKKIREEAQMAVAIAGESAQESIEVENTANARRNEALAGEHKAATEEKHALETEKKAKAEEKEAKAREDDLNQAELQAKARTEEARKAENEMKKAAAEVRQALAKVLAEEKKISEKKSKLKSVSNDPKMGTVRRNSAVHQLAQMENKPSLGLQTAKVTLTAAEKRAQKSEAPFKKATARAKAAEEKISQARAEAESARKAATASRAVAEADAKAATASRETASKLRMAANEALIVAIDKRREAEEAFADAESKLKELLAKPTGTGQGADWWLQREFAEAKKYMPKSKLRRLSQA